VNVYCLTGLHAGVFQSLDGSLCSHTFWTPTWDDNKEKPSNVRIMTKEMIEDPDENFFDCILIFPEHYEKVKNIDKPIIVYFVMNGREGQDNNYTKHILNNPRVIPLFVSTGCRLSRGIFDGKHKTIYPGIDENFWKGWTGEDKKIIHVRNEFEKRDKEKYNDFLKICDGNDYTLVGNGGTIQCGPIELRGQFIKHRMFVNVEIYTSTFSISSMEAMMTGLPIVCNDIEGTGEAIQNGKNGFISNNLDYLKKKVNDLMNDHDMAKELGANSRKMAKLKFSKSQFNAEWEDFLTNLDYYRR